MVNPSRVPRLILGVIKEALRSAGLEGVVVSGGGPEENLLAGWLEEAGIPCPRPDEEEIREAAHLMGTKGSGLASVGEASSIAGHILALKGNFLHLGTANKTLLLLSANPPIQPILPLGDLFASELFELVGGASLPSCLRDRPKEDVNAVDSALDAYYSDGEERAMALRRVPSEIRGGVRDAWIQARKGWHLRPLIPKLGEATLGLDLDP